MREQSNGSISSYTIIQPNHNHSVNAKFPSNKLKHFDTHLHNISFVCFIIIILVLSRCMHFVFIALLSFFLSLSSFECFSKKRIENFVGFVEQNGSSDSHMAQKVDNLSASNIIIYLFFCRDMTIDSARFQHILVFAKMKTFCFSFAFVRIVLFDLPTYICLF